MTTSVTPYHSHQPRRSLRFAGLLWAEWTKFRTVRGWIITLVVAALVMVLLSLLGASGTGSTYCNDGICTTVHRPVAIGPGGQPVADSYTFVHRSLVGNGSLTVRVTSLSGAHTVSTGVSAPNSPSGPAVGPRTALPASIVQSGLAPWAKAGLLVERTIRQGSGYAAVMVTGNHGVRMQDDYTHDTAAIPGATSASSPRWLRIARVRDVIVGADSIDGVHWSRIGTVHLTGLARTVQIGLFVTSPVIFAAGSHNGSPSAATASFDAVAGRGDFREASWTGQTIGAGDIYPTMPSEAGWHQRSDHGFTVTGSGDIAPLVGGGVIATDAAAITTSLLVGGLAELIVLIVLSTLFVTSEYRRGLINTTFVASPHRARVLAAKAIVVAGVAFVTGLVGTAVALALARKVVVANGNFVFPLTSGTEARIIIGSGLLMAAVAVLALALGTALRRSAGAVVGCMALLVLPFVLAAALPVGASNWLMRLTPAAAFSVLGTQPRSTLVTNVYNVVNGYYPLAPWAGLAVLFAYVAVAVAVCVWLLRHRDV